MRKASETPAPAEEDLMRTTFEVPRSLVDQFRLVAKRNERTLSAELRQLMREAVEREAA